MIQFYLYYFVSIRTLFHSDRTNHTLLDDDQFREHYGQYKGDIGVTYGSNHVSDDLTGDSQLL